MSDEMEVKKNKSQEELDREFRELELEEKRYSLMDLKRRIADRDIREKQQREDREAQGRSFAQQKATDELRWRTCTHKKGGIVKPRDLRALSFGGNSPQYSVFKHQMMNGDIWVRCSRCGRTWAPPVEDNFYFDANGKVVPPNAGKFNRDKFSAAVDEYQKAINFDTNNTMSGSVQCRFTRFNPKTGNWEDASREVAHLLKDTNLR